MISTEPRRRFALLLATWIVWPSLLCAQTPPSTSPALRCDRDEACNRGYEQAQRLIKANKRQEALESLTALYERYRDEWLTLPIARQEHLLGRFSDAEQHYQRWLAADVEPDPARVASVRRYLDEVRQQLAAEKQKKAAETPAATVLTPPPLPVTTEPSLAVSQGAASDQAPQNPASKPLYRRAWFWGVIGGSAAVALGLGVGLGLGLGANRSGSDPNYRNVVTPEF
ncbi:MAG: hypothetical protein U1A78_19175 [Polyangia bacterium]